MSDRRLDLIYNCDANAAMFERDLGLIKYMVDLKKETGYPKKWRAAYAKNSNDRVFNAAKMLNDAGMAKGVTLSFQSMDDHTLEVIKRKNIKVKDFANLMRRYNTENISSYSEIIVGLPGETYDSFADGLDTLLAAGQHGGVNVYSAEILPNAEMNEPEYKAKHKIRAVDVPVLVYHGSPDTADEHQERYELVVGTATLSTPDWMRCEVLAMFIQGMHCLPLLQAVAVFCHKQYGVRYRHFYERLIDFMAQQPVDCLVRQVYDAAVDQFAGVVSGKGLGFIDQRFGNIIWPPEEWAFLALMTEKDRVYRELLPFFDSLIPDADLRDQLLDYQRALVIDPHQVAEAQFLALKWNLHEYVQGVCRNDEPELIAETAVYLVTREQFGGDLEKYAKHTWFSRKGGSFLNTLLRREQCKEFFPRGNGPHISVLLPTRGRVPYLMQSVDTLWSLSVDKNVEFCFKADSDDEETIAAIDSLSNMVPTKKLITPRGNGYHDMHSWLNSMAAMCPASDWLMVWNDDALMRTAAWDQVIRFCGTAKPWDKIDDVAMLVLRTISRPMAQEFFLIRRKVFDLLGHLSLSQHTDTWLYSVMKHCEATMTLPVYVDHFSNLMTDDTRQQSEAAYATTINTLNSFEGKRGRIKDMLTLLDYMQYGFDGRAEKSKRMREWYAKPDGIKVTVGTGRPDNG